MSLYLLKKNVFLLLLLITTNTYCQTEKNEENKNSSPIKSLSISTNIATLCLGISYNVSDRNELLLDGSFSHWNFGSKDRPRYWRSWNLSPQIRSYFNEDKSTYLGAQLSLGQYNISSQQGEYIGGGIAFGKQYYVAKNLVIDLGLTLGYLSFKNRASYIYHDNTFYTNRVKDDSNYWGPTSVSIKFSRKIM
jgi:hypothetical protein